MGRDRWHENGDELRSYPGLNQTEHTRWMYYVLINRAEVAVKRYLELPEHQKPTRK